MSIIDDKLSELVGKRLNTYPCPDCGALMIIRRNRESGSYFLGCARWPDCDTTRPVPEDLKMKLLGQKTMF